MQTKIENGNLVITIPIEPLRPSDSGKTLLAGSSGGNKPTELKIEGKTLRVSDNRYVYAKGKRAAEIVKAELA